jgi:flagellar basal body-associated protein FliL
MKYYATKSRTVSLTLFILALMSATFFTSQVIQAENRLWSSKASQTSQQPANQDANQSTDQKTFTGVIVKSGDKVVLTDPLTKTSYQLDEQRKAQELVNKNVKVTGVLDPSTGTIRVSAIEPI